MVRFVIPVGVLGFAVSCSRGETRNAPTREQPQLRTECYSVAVGAFNAKPLAINDDGIVLLDTTTREPGDDPFSGRLGLWRGGAQTELAIPAGYRAIRSGVMNERGDVVFVARSGDDSNVSEALFHRRSGVTSPVRHGAVPITAAGELAIVVAGVNESGAIAGTIRESSGRRHAFLWRGDELIDVGRAGEDSTATDINEAGWVVGFDKVEGRGRAFVWRDGEHLLLDSEGFLPPRGDEAVLVNDRGLIAMSGQVSAVPDSPHRAFVWREGVLTELGTFGGNRMRVRAMNNAGWVVGEATNASGDGVGFLWRDGDLTSFGSADEVTDVNERGQITGSNRFGLEDRPFVWDSGAFTILPHTPERYHFVYPLNERGEIAGYESIGEGDTTPLLWRPDRCASPDDGGVKPPPPEDPGEE